LRGWGFRQAKQAANREMGNSADQAKLGLTLSLPANELAGYADEAHKSGLFLVGFRRLRFSSPAFQCWAKLGGGGLGAEFPNTLTRLGATLLSVHQSRHLVGRVKNATGCLSAGIAKHRRR